ncbi:potassium-transporting ATPase subunit KdpA [Oscillibacter sp. MSJ-2]|uniref:Potassium-transporting ATPase potassium-binding subunit n=1 Tax=Dysosmobacter acutus TaxID=2841504 RepID=A0ABS6F5A3_9FIRM|nr:potassium-transporting ATPase subunit KdpA [Dysosmobacter acutus]MBU5625473.1 potassium-transporting ATPase subunit KdpA [Dysosmobacter acutus]
MNPAIQYVLYVVILVALALPLGIYMSKIMGGERTVVSRTLGPVERGVYKLLRIDPKEDMGWKKYLAAALLFNLFGFAVLFLILLFQGHLPWNPQGLDGLSWHLAFNTAVSFVTNTNWQAYSGEVTLSNFSQAMGLTVQNFVSAASGIAVLYALIRGLVRARAKGIGNFWQDLTRCTLYILLPICLISTLVLTSQGVPQTLGGNRYVDLVEPIAIDVEGNALSSAEIDLEAGTVTVDGQTVPGAQIVTQQVLPLYPQASQVAMKQLGTNGGGVLGNNSAHPFENPNLLTNTVEMIFLLVIAVGLCFSFGRSISKMGVSHGMRQGTAIFLAMFIMMIAAMWIGAVHEAAATPVLEQNGLVDTALGNMEGKETRFGVTTSNTWAVWTTCASNGSVNSMHDSYTPLGGMIPMLLMMLGEVVFGGVGCGLYGMIGFVILTVFIAGLMVGRTPEYLGKKIEPREMRMAVLLCLATPIAILIGSGIAALLPGTMDSLNNTGAHGLSEVLYAYSSGGGNNGSAFAGFNANTPFLNISIGLVMLFARFVPMAATVVIAGSMAAKRKVAESAGTLSTSNAMFVFLLILIVLIIGALSFFPALSLGPIAEYTEMIGLS